VSVAALGVRRCCNSSEREEISAQATLLLSVRDPVAVPPDRTRTWDFRVRRKRHRRSRIARLARCGGLPTAVPVRVLPRHDIAIDARFGMMYCGHARRDRSV
jgi:hypothetical protein